MTIWCMRVAFCIPKSTNTHSEYAILIIFHCNNGCPKAPQYYVILTLAVLCWSKIKGKFKWTLKKKNASRTNSMGCSETSWRLYRLKSIALICLTPRLSTPYPTRKLHHSEGHRTYHGTSRGGLEICAQCLPISAVYSEIFCALNQVMIWQGHHKNLFANSKDCAIEVEFLFPRSEVSNAS